MELRQLQYLVAAVEEGGFTRAAARVHVAQPAVSQQIAQLEKELGERLFDRSERRVRLTPAGEAFLPHARAALEAVGAGRDAVTSLRGELAGRLVIGTIPWPPEWLLERLGRFGSRHPRVSLVLRTGDPRALAADVAAGALDAALIGLASGRLPEGPGGQRLPASLASYSVPGEPLGVALAPGHPLLTQDDQAKDDLAQDDLAVGEVALARLRDEAIVTLGEGSGLRTVVESACAEAGFAPRIRVETDDLTLMSDLVAHGLGVAVLPLPAVPRVRRDLVIVGLREPVLHRAMALVWHRRAVSVPGRAFLDLAGAHETEPGA
ncbi:LysR family transcriptional regulator [Microbispora sp. RL4-1S]|uniref:LysR family transcriptional regulator n=1 Tax=Microbispora oryzae TaxID=2806554 RepID=A0A941AMS0_9ACTN|nr:LysR substrate-binding domain-containing protein [Microbispora oryzae]MBP2707593.1 LysR family transcriptional regulator [Microbispora oryzae]